MQGRLGSLALADGDLEKAVDFLRLAAEVLHAVVLWPPLVWAQDLKYRPVNQNVC